ncbi:hypothetical protein WDW86_06940 [Bdellovibrionota bacterium FG-2]
MVELSGSISFYSNGSVESFYYRPDFEVDTRYGVLVSTYYIDIFPNGAVKKLSRVLVKDGIHFGASTFYGLNYCQHIATNPQVTFFKDFLHNPIDKIDEKLLRESVSELVKLLKGA